MQIKYREFPYAYPITTAQNKCRERYLGFKFILKIPKLFFPNRDVYTLCYAYFRWFDDIVDSLRLHPKESQFIVDRQKRFLSELYSEESPEELSTEELFLAHLVRFDKFKGKNIRQDLETLVKSLEFDSTRVGKVISSLELEEYIDNNVIPYVNISSAILNIEDNNKQDLVKISRAGFVIDYIYDLREDLALGYINIPSEDLEKYKINIGKLDNEEIKFWVKDKMENLRNILFSNPFNQLPLTARMISEAMISKRRNKFKKIEGNNYLPV